MLFKLKNNKIKEVISELKKASKTHAGQAEKLQSALPKRMGKFKHSDAPDAKGKFKSLSASALATPAAIVPTPDDATNFTPIRAFGFICFKS